MSSGLFVVFVIFIFFFVLFQTASRRKIMFGAGLHDIHALHGDSISAAKRRRLSRIHHGFFAMAVAASTALIVAWGASFHAGGTVALPERFRTIRPVYVPLVTTFTTLVALSEYPLMVLAYYALHVRFDEFLVGLCMASVRVLCATCLEYFIIHNTSESALVYYSRIVGVLAATYFHNAIIGWKTYASKRPINAKT